VAAAAAAHPRRQAGGAGGAVVRPSRPEAVGVAVGGGVPLKQAAEEGGEGEGSPPR